MILDSGIFFLQYLLLVLLFPVNSVADDFRFVKTEQIMLQTTFKSFQEFSAVKCCVNCAQTTGCESVSFNPSRRVCLLSAVSGENVATDGTFSTDWNTYSLIIKSSKMWKCLLIWFLIETVLAYMYNNVFICVIL